MVENFSIKIKQTGLRKGITIAADICAGLMMFMVIFQIFVGEKHIDWSRFVVIVIVAVLVNIALKSEIHVSKEYIRVDNQSFPLKDIKEIKISENGKIILTFNSGEINSYIIDANEKNFSKEKFDILKDKITIS